MYKARGQCQASFSATLSTTWSPLIREEDTPVPGSRHWDCKLIPPYLAFYVDAGARAQVLVLASQVLYQVPQTQQIFLIRPCVMMKRIKCDMVAELRM